MPGSQDRPRLPPGQTIDTLLLNFLQEELQERAEGHTLRSLHTSLVALREDMDAGFSAMDGRFERQNRRLVRLEGTDMFDTGQHKPVPDVKAADVDAKITIDRLAHEKSDLEQRLAEKKENETWWRRRTLQWVVGGIGFLVVQIISFLLGALAMRPERRSP